MAKLGKHKQLGSGKKGGFSNLAKPEKVSGPGHILINHGTHGILGLATREVGEVEVPFLKVKANPDTLGLGLAVAAYAFGGKKMKKLAFSAGSGAAHAIEGRMIWSGKKLEKTAEKPVETSGVSESGLEAMISRIVEKSVAKAVANMARDEGPAEVASEDSVAEGEEAAA